MALVCLVSLALESLLVGIVFVASGVSLYLLLARERWSYVTQASSKLRSKGSGWITGLKDNVGALGSPVVFANLVMSLSVFGVCLSSSRAVALLLTDEGQHWIASVVRAIYSFGGITPTFAVGGTSLVQRHIALEKEIRVGGVTTEEYLADRSQPTFLSGLALAIFTLVVGDAIMVCGLPW